MSARVQDLVNQAKAARGVVQPPAKPVATPTRIRSKSRGPVGIPEAAEAKTAGKELCPTEGPPQTPQKLRAETPAPEPTMASTPASKQKQGPAEPKQAQTPAKPITKALATTPGALQPSQTPTKVAQTPDAPADAAMAVTPASKSFLTPAPKPQGETPVPMSVQSALSTPMRSPDHKRIKTGFTGSTLRSMPSLDSPPYEPSSSESELRHVDTQSTIVHGMDSLSLRL